MGDLGIHKLQNPYMWMQEYQLFQMGVSFQEWVQCFLNNTEQHMQYQ